MLSYNPFIVGAIIAVKRLFEIMESILRRNFPVVICRPRKRPEGIFKVVRVVLSLQFRYVVNSADIVAEPHEIENTDVFAFFLQAFGFHFAAFECGRKL